MTGSADFRANRSACWRPRVRGPTPMTTKLITDMMTTASRKRPHAPSMPSAIRTATTTTAAVSATMRSRSTVLM